MMMMNSTIIITCNRSLSSVSAIRSSSRSFLQSPLRRQQGKDATKNNFSSSAQAEATTTTSASGSSSSSSSTTNTIGKIFFPSLCAITFTLGTWQTKRYFEKIDLVQKRKDDLSLDPLLFDQWRRLNHDGGIGNNSDDGGGGASLGSNNSGNNDSNGEATKSYRRVIIQGKFDHTNSILIGPRGPPPGALATSGPNSGLGGGGGMSSSMQGYWVVTPLIVGEEEEEEEKRLGECSLSMEEDLSSRKEGWLDRLLPWRRRNHNTTSDQQSHSVKSDSADTDSTTSTKKPSSSDKPTTTVWINRGWIPRHYINPNTNQILQSWDEPKEHVTVLSMESQTEKGRGMFTPPSRVDPVVGGKAKGGSNNKNGARVNNDENNTIRKLLWMDREAMEEMTNCSSTNDHPPLFVQINTTSADNMNTKTESKISFPVQPSEEYVGEFKVTPDVHMGYAITWFGLSGAGVIMTRKLLTRGR